MSTVTQRTFRASPERPAGDVWKLISELIAPDADSSARKELTSIAGVAGLVIAAQYPESDAIILRGNGPRVRIYCLYGAAAVSCDGAREAALSTTPTEGDWKLSLPAAEEDVEFFRAALAGKSKRFSIRALGETVDGDDEETSQKSGTAAASGFDAQAFLDA